MEPAVDRVLHLMREARQAYHRLVLVVGSSGSGKTAVLQKVSAATSAPLVNINLELSRWLLDLTERQRALRVQPLLSDIVRAAGGGPALLDNIEILFAERLKQDPLRLLQGLSRNKTIVAAWNGAITNEYLTYAIPGHPEYRRYPARGLYTVTHAATER